ncbi:hypothetical protein [Methanosarcina mazei]|jgi:hypothetical protein|uniref:Uncharacterized protein n=1 Tax=Methanosarcina mazei TaxID=2209 RepID=A0A0F8MA22_METMZ|nr:hypothetical protein [Methanosarcina mazei]KKG01795.1 hypothetical protein DU31_10860 [Methanosarcina mazei]KKG05592.1 hypothetical protein DU40_08885 [Methanosarcina mazei]KKG06181.1 hypothetical protein DU47_13115 [Methanosarcina mazei]KKG12417.1 hypothetical protein DU34_15845 [Methanosarcina mazei]KKG28284.1 hypothetical protein DU52_10380 [Methanosarcina mazei]
MAALVIAVYLAVIFFALTQKAKKYSKKVKMSMPENLAGNQYYETYMILLQPLQTGFCFSFH